MTRIPGTSRFLITYTDVCVQAGWDFVIGRMGTIEYTPSTNTLSGKKTLFTAPSPGAELSSRLWLGSPVFSGSHLYLFSSECTGEYSGACTGGSVIQARVLSGDRGTATAYKFRQGSNWIGDVAQATTAFQGATPKEVSVDNFAGVGRGFVMVELTSIGGHYRVWEASSLTGTWTQRGGTRTVDLCTPPTGVVDFCHALIAQPELSTSSKIAVTHYSAAEQRIRMTMSTW